MLIAPLLLLSSFLFPQQAPPPLPSSSQTQTMQLSGKERKRQQKQKEKEGKSALRQAKRQEKYDREGQESIRSIEVAQGRDTLVWASYAESPDQVKAALVSTLTAHGYGIVVDSQFQITFVANVTGLSGFATQLLLGNAYSDTPKEALNFTFIPTQGQVTVRASMGVFVRMPLGNINSVDMSRNPNWKADIKHLLETMLPPLASGP